MTALLLASALGGVALTWLLSAAAGASEEVAARRLPNDGCDDICDTPAWRGLLAGWSAAAAQLPVVVVAAVALLIRRHRPHEADKRFMQ
jgi:hypothetical protein